MAKTNKIHLPLVIFGLLVIALSPYIFTSHSCFEGFDFTETGQIGDTVGGLTAPFVGTFGAILVYISFLKQVEANEFLKKEIDRTNFFTIYNEITELLELTNKEFDNIKYGEDSGDKAFDTWFDRTKKKDLKEVSNKHFLKECFYVLELVDKTCKSIETFSDLNDTENGRLQLNPKIPNSNFNFKNLLRVKFTHFYEMKYEPTIIRLKEYDEAKEIKNLLTSDYEFRTFINDKNDEDKRSYILFRKILIRVRNIEVTYRRKNIKFWGEQKKSK